MNTVERTNVTINDIDNMLIYKLEDSKEELKQVNTFNTILEELPSFEFDRTFNNIDLIEGLKIEMIEFPNRTFDTNATVNTIIPIKTYNNNIQTKETFIQDNKF